MGFTARKLLLKNNKITWNQVTLPNSTPYGVAYGNGSFVAVGSTLTNPSNIVVLSNDGGKTWGQVTLPDSGPWVNIAFGGGVFIAIRPSYTPNIVPTPPSPSPSAIAYSGNGSLWTRVNISLSCNLIAYGNGRFVGFRTSSDNEIIYSSNNGVTWTIASLPISLGFRAVTYGNGRFVAIGTTNSLYSNDGITWVATTLPISGAWQSVTYGGGRFVCVANTGYGIYSDDGGETWTQFSLPSTGSDWRRVAYGNGVFVATIGISGFGYSNNGIDWQVLPMPSSGNWWPIEFGGNKFAALTNGTNIAAYTT